MTLTYIFHSGFVLETGQSVLIFDYWMDPGNVVPQFLQKDKPLYVFSSHFHEDHFNRDIFGWRKQRENITYILSKDILRHRRATKGDADVWLAKGGTWTDGVVSVWATGSNDSGVSWIVETEDKAAIKQEQSQNHTGSAERKQARPEVRRIFHAGDLNNWYAKFLPDAVPGQTIYSEEFQEDIDPIAHEKQYLGELKDIRKITDSFDVAMFPTDGRIGNGYTLGGRQFIDRFKVGLFVPMHFSRPAGSHRPEVGYVASGFASAWRFKEYADEKDVPFWEISKEGDSIEII